MIVLGITGGVGAGKSTVLHRLESVYHACVVQADQVGHLLMKRGQACYEPIVDLFGAEVLDDTGEIDRKKLGAIVFFDRELLEKLNKIVHPAVKSYILKKIDEKRSSECRLFVVEAALLLEDHYDRICDDLWYIYVDDRIRRERLKADRGYSDAKIDGILKNQLSDEVFRRSCKYTIENSGDLEKTYQQIDMRVKSYGIV